MQDVDHDVAQDDDQEEGSMHIEEPPSAHTETATCSSNDENRVIVNENNVIDILNQYNPSITDNQNEDDESQFQDNLLDFSDELLVDDSDMYADENAIFLPEEVADEVEDETAKLFKESDQEGEKPEPQLYAGT